MALETAYRETVEYLYALQKHGVKLALANTCRLMELMGNPHEKFRSVHVAGSNGKGSTSAFIARMLMAAGYRVGLYTSPHLVSFTERIRINGVPIAEEDVVSLTGRVRDAYQGVLPEAGGDRLNPTFFEVTTAVAFTYFARSGIDIAVVETGMGGRLDATNVITPLLSVITNIALEHTEYLGETLEQIAGEKAGIIKPGIAVVTGEQRPGIADLFERNAARKGARFSRLGRDFYPDKVVSLPEPSFDYHGIRAHYKGLHVQMLGRYQVDNACVALAAVEHLFESGVVVNEEAVRQGLARTRWEGRMERVARQPDIYLDGAHNPASAAVLASLLGALKRHYGRIILVIGILGDKDYREILRILTPLAARVIVTKAQYARALDSGALAAEAARLHPDVTGTESVGEAVHRARCLAAPDDLIIVTGSLYVVGDARALLAPDTGTSGLLAGLKG